MAMCSLRGFPALAPEGHSALCEVEGRVHSMPIDHANIATFTNAVAKHPVIVITQELLHPVSLGVCAFLPVAEPLLKRVFNVWCEDGFVAALSLADQESFNAFSIFRLGTRILMKFLKGVNHLQSLLQSHPREFGTALISPVSQNRDWAQSSVRCIAWHPHCTKLAIALADDSVRVYWPDSSLVPVLKAKTQRFVTCMAWRPLSASELAVGCECGIIVWDIDPNSVATRPSPSCATILKQPRHSPVTSLAWSSQGALLLSASATDPTMYVWDVAMENSAPLYKLGGGISLITWSPDSARVFAATCSTVFRVWETNNWNSETWHVMAGHVQTACWSPCSSMLLFSTSEEPLVYSLTFKSNSNAMVTTIDNAVVKALPVIDLSEVVLENGECIGGSVVSMVWDNKGRHLAIMFRGSNAIVVFRTDIQSILQVSPCCFVKGMPGEMPNTINFQQNFTEGALLTIGWSSGRIQYFPFICNDMYESVVYPDHSLLGIDTSLANISRRGNYSFRSM